jgi:hypothetical protein
MALAVVLGVLLKVETIGFDGPPPSLPRPPINVHQGRDGQRLFVYDFSPAEENLSVEDVCARIGSRIERVLNAPDSPFHDAPFAARLTLEFGILADREDTSFTYAWPPEFLRALVDSDIILNVSHYLPSPDKEDGA